MDGGSGNDTYVVYRPNSVGWGPVDPDTLIDSSGHDTVVLTGEWFGFALAPGFEDLVVGSSFVIPDDLFTDSIVLQGNASDNLIRVDTTQFTSFFFDGQGGNDLLIGHAGEDLFFFGANHGHDVVDGAGGSCDDPRWLRINRHSWTRSKHHWFVVPPGVETFEQSALPSPNLNR